MSAQRIMTVLLGIGTATLVGLLLLALVNGQVQYAINDAIAALLLGGLLVAHVRGFRWTAQVMVVLACLLLIAVAPANPGEDRTFAFAVLTPTILAAVLLPWYWGVGAFIVCFGGLAIRWGGVGTLFDPATIFLLILQTAGIALSSVTSRTAQHRAEANAERAEEALAEAERQQLILAEQAESLAQQNAQQQRLLDLVSMLEVPTVTLADGVILAPVVGTLDSRRAAALTSRLLTAVSEQRAHLLILDIVGVTSVDTLVARALIDTTRAVALLGCEITISGISAAVATTLTHLNITLDGIKTARSPQDALREYQLRSEAPAQKQVGKPAGKQVYGLN